MPETDQVGAFFAVDRLRGLFAREVFPEIGSVSLSALYLAKQSGRDRTFLQEDRRVSTAGGR